MGNAELWCADHENHKTCLRLYGALQLDDETYPIPDRDAPNRHFASTPIQSTF